MQTFHIVKEIKPKKTYRVASVIDRYDLQYEHLKETFKGEIKLDESWKIGCIVGTSGTGKTTVAKEMFGKSYIENYEYKNESILDDFDKDLSIEEITKTFNSVGFSSPPSWLKPYKVLSNGEKMRVDLARALLTEKDLIVFDEFTSVVDRNVAKISSFAVSKSIRKSQKKFIAITCHYDILNWLCPDWILDTNKMEFKNTRGLLQRSSIELNVYQSKNYWDVFRKYHYLNTNIHKGSTQFVAFYENKPVAFSSAMAFPHPTEKNIYRGHRTVVLPDYQGLGFGNRLSEYVAKYYLEKGKRFLSITSSPSMLYSRQKSKNWKLKRFGRVNPMLKSGRVDVLSCDRFTSSWEYING